MSDHAIETADQRYNAISFRLLSFLSALFVYAFFGTPTPDAVGWPEIVTGVFLVMAVLPSLPFVFFRSGMPAWQGAALLFFIYGTVAASFNGLLRGNDTALMFRDIVPFLYLLLPLLLYPLCVRGDAPRYLAAATAFVGVVFALRVVMPVSGSLSLQSPMLLRPSDPAYLANAPTVLFAALWLCGLAGRKLFGSLAFSAHIKAAVFLLAGSIPLAAMALIIQRASIGYFVLAMAVLLVIGLLRRPDRVFYPLLLSAAVGVLFWPVMSDIWLVMAHKTTLVGMNMRLQEAQAVFNEVSGDFISVLFGKGWGATVASPAVGGVTVNFTHSLLTTYFLKTGLAGLTLAFLFLYRVGVGLVPLMRRNPLMALALAGPFFIDIFLYASFKSLDFGLILLLIALWGSRGVKGRDARLQEVAGYSKE